MAARDRAKINAVLLTPSIYIAPKSQLHTFATVDSQFTIINILKKENCSFSDHVHSTHKLKARLPDGYDYHMQSPAPVINFSINDQTFK